MKTRSLLFLPALLLLVGCSNVGDTNPVSPEKMEEIRNKTNADRANFQPKGGERPPSGN